MRQPESPPGENAAPLNWNASELARSFLNLLRRDRFLVLLLAAAFLTRVFWAVAIPAFQAPDEPQHFSYIQSLGEGVRFTPSEFLSQEIGTVESLTGLDAVPFHPAETQMFAADSLEGPKEEALDDLPGSLRTTDQVGRKDTAKQYPPTYYLLASVVYRILSSFDLLTILVGVRILSALLSTGTILFSYLTLKRFFEEDGIAKSCALIVAMSPMYAYMGAAVNSDVLVWLVFSIFLYLMTRAFDEGLSPGMNLALGMTMVVGTLVKQTFLIAVPMYVILLCFLWYKRLLAPKQAAYSLAAVLGMLAVLDGWLYVSGLVTTSPTFVGEHPEERTIGNFIRHLHERWDAYSGTFDTFWGNFGWLDTPLSSRIYGLIRTGSAIAAVGLVFHLASSFVARRPDLKATFFVMISVTYVAAWVAINYLGISRGEAWVIQGRYFFTIIVPIVALLLRGLLFYVPQVQARNVILVALVVGVFWLQVDALSGYIIPRFYA